MTDPSGNQNGPYILALDQGTTSSRAIVFDHGGAVRGVAQREITQHFPRPGWVEHDPAEIWATQRQVMEEAVGHAGVGPDVIAAIGITNQRETTVVWDRETGDPIAPAVVWQDRRTAGYCEELKRGGHEAVFRERTGLVLDPYFSGTKIRWLLNHVEGARDRADQGRLAFGTIDSWLVWNLTGGARHVTDASNASRTLLFDIHKGAWDPELLRLLDVPDSLLPTVVSSSEVCGTVDCNSLLDGISIAGIAGDQHAALFGQTCFEPGMAKNTYGTGCFMLLNTGETPVVSNNNLLTTVAWQIDGRTEYALEGSVFVGGAVVQWLRDNLDLIESSVDVEALAASVEDTDGVYFVPAFVGLGAPHWDPYARGAIFGMTRGTTSAHIARAALESIAFQCRDLLDAMKRDATLDLDELRVDGGACANNLLMQFQADVLGVPVVRPQQIETTALGVAYLAGLAVGTWDSQEEIAEQWQRDRLFTPARSDAEVATLLAGWERAVERACRWITEDGPPGPSKR